MRTIVVIHYLGQLTLLLGVLLVIPGIIAAVYLEPLSIMAFTLTSILAISIGIVMTRMGVKGELKNNEAFIVVSFGWLLEVFLGSFPFVFLGLSPLDALFESMSGFTTTGATILTEYDQLGYWTLNSEDLHGSLAYTLTAMLSNYFSGYDFSKVLGIMPSSIDFSHLLSIKGTFYGLLFWRSFSQLLGGLGVLLLFMAILPNLGPTGRQLYFIESSALSRELPTARLAQTAKIFWGIYLGLVALEIVALMAAGMPIYDSLCTAFTTLATGGFSPKAYSIAAYSSPAIEAIVLFFMFLGATSFFLHYKVIVKRELSALRENSEFKFYIFLLIFGTAVVTLWGDTGGDLISRFRLASFQVVSTMTTTGFTNNTSYNSWSLGARMTLTILMLVGGCISSTGGALKVGRVLILLKYCYHELYLQLHPRAVVPIRMGGISLKGDVIRSVLFFSLLYLMVFIGASLAMAVLESSNPQFNMISAFSAVATCMGGVGPGFGVVAFDFSQMSEFSKVIGIICMYVGRLEIIPVLVLFLPDLWRE
jgi:trk system potassium uptake protein